jgi:septal ring factor EnvC (AmiA/AmiB activator)
MFFRITILFLLSFQLLYSAENRESQLKKSENEFDQFNSQLSRISKTIIDEQSAIKKIDEELKNVGKELYRDKYTHKKEQKKLKLLRREERELLEKHKKVQKSAIDLSAKIISLSIVMDGGDLANLDEIILNQAFHVLVKKSGEELEKINKSLSARDGKIKELLKKVGKIEAGIGEIEQKKRSILEKKRERKKRLLTLESKKKEYKNKLNEVVNRQKRLQKEIEKARKEREQREIRANKSKNSRSTKNSKITTKDLGDSYLKESVRRYRGKKTISPISGYRVIRNFGNYRDPIYNIKLFNSSVALQPHKRGAKVKSIFNGKISLVKDDKILGKFVVIEHFNGLQTVYAHLTSFAPNIKSGKKVKKGTIIGRVDDELYFEVMEKSYHINPLQVIE